MAHENSEKDCPPEARRDAIVDALNKSIEIFSANVEDTFNEVMANGIRPLADAVGLNRVVFYKLLDIKGDKRLGQVYRWDKSEGGLMYLAEELAILPNHPVLDEWMSITSRGECVRFRKSDYTEDVAAFLRHYGVISILIVPIFTHGNFWGVINFQDHANDRYFDEGCADMLYTAARVFSSAIIREESERSAQAAIKALERREKMSDTLNRVSVMFLSHRAESFEEAMTAGVREMADVFNLDRLSIWRNINKPDALHASQIYRWDRESGGTTVPTPGLEDVTYARLAPRWESLFAKGEIINSPVRLLPEAAMLRSFGVVSAFIAPIFINNAVWGFALLEDRHIERFFEKDSVEMMLSAILLCVNTVMRADMEREIVDANEFTRAVLDASPLGFTVFDENARVIDCNDFTLNALKTTKEYYLEHFYEFSPEYQSDGTKSTVKAVEVVTRALNGENMVLEWMNRTSAGKPIPYEVTLVRAMYRGKQVVMGYQYDLRNLKKMTESIREQGELLKIRLDQQELISDLSRGFISSGDSEMLVKEAIAKLGRYHDVSLVFVFSIDHLHKNTRLAYCWYADNTSPRTLIANLFEYVMSIFPEYLPDGTAIPIVACGDTSADPGPVFQALCAVDTMAVIGAPLYVEGRIWGIVSVEQNSTTRAWTENEKNFVSMTASTIAGIIMRDIYTIKLKDALHKATEASKAKGEFLSNMSHEMRTPLNAITGMTTIGKNAKDLERKDYALGKIQDASTHLLGLINDVLDMSKIEANMLVLSSIEFSFEKALKRVIELINFRVDEKSQKFTVRIDNAIPDTLVGDDQRLVQVIINLLGNAVKFTPENGSVTLDAHLADEESDRCTIQISVSDTGIGISPEQQAHLFQSFQQADGSTVRKFGGTGLGLAISKKIVEMMCGKIWIESEIGKGSNFIFTVKMRRGTKQEPVLAETEAPSKDSDTPIVNTFAGRRVLLAEDVEINREIVIALLEPTQLQIDCAVNGSDAVNMFAKAPDKYDLILMDVQMPGMDGYEATRIIRAMDAPNAKTVPILAMTANVFQEDIEKCLHAGMDSHIGKPLDLDEVLEKLRQYLAAPATSSSSPQ